MPKLFKSQVKAAISAILARKAPPTPIFPTRFPRRNFRKRLEPVFVDAGFDINKLNKIAAEERKKFAHDNKKIEQQYEKRNSALAKQYQATLKHKKLALQAIADQTIGVVTVPVDTASSVASFLGGRRADEILASKSLEPWNNWVKFYHHDPNDTDQYGKQVSVKFFFAWHNSTDYTLIVHANADVIIRGYCSVLAQGGFISPGSVNLKLFAGLKAYPGSGGGITVTENPIWGTYIHLLELQADTYADILGGDGDWVNGNFFIPTNVVFRHLLVKRGQLIIFEVSVDFRYHILNGIAEIEFTYLDRNVTCPALVIEYGGEPEIGPG